jgi:hypothetical protein
MFQKILLFTWIVSFNFLFAQEIDFVYGTSTVNIGKDLHTIKTEDNNYFTVGYYSITYCNTHNKTNSTTYFKKCDFTEKRIKKNSDDLSVIGLQLENENLVVFGVLKEKIGNSILVYELRFDTDCKLISDKIVDEYKSSLNTNYRIVLNEKTNEKGLVIYDNQQTSLLMRNVKQSMKVIVYNPNLTKKATTEYEMFDIKTSNIDYPASSDQLHIFKTMKMLEDGSVYLIYKNKLYFGLHHDSKLREIELNLEKNINSIEIIKHKSGYKLVAAYYDNSSLGIVSMFINEDFVAEEKEYVAISPKIATEFKSLAHAVNGTSAKGKTTTYYMWRIVPEMIDFTIDEDGTFRGVIMLIGTEKNDHVFRANYTFVGIKNGELIYEHVIPYYFRGYNSFFSAPYVFFTPTNTVLFYSDFMMNFDSNGKFSPSTKGVKMNSKMDYAIASYDKTTQTCKHSLLEVKDQAIGYNPLKDAFKISDFFVDDETILIRLRKNATSSKSTFYSGTLRLP